MVHSHAQAGLPTASACTVLLPCLLPTGSDQYELMGGAAEARKWRMHTRMDMHTCVHMAVRVQLVPSLFCALQVRHSDLLGFVNCAGCALT